MKYKITLEEMTSVKEKQRNWVKVDPYEDDDGETKMYDYRDEVVEVASSKEVYSQVVESEKFDIKKVIDAFNQ